MLTKVTVPQRHLHVSDCGNTYYQRGRFVLVTYRSRKNGPALVRTLMRFPTELGAKKYAAWHGKRADLSQTEAHIGHFARITDEWYCDTCESPYCELA